MFPGDRRHGVATVDESFRLGAILVPPVEPSLERCAHAVVTAVDTAIGALRVFVPLDLGITGLGDQLGQRREQCLLVHLRGGCEEALYELDILLRHRPAVSRPGVGQSARCPGHADAYSVRPGVVLWPGEPESVRSA